MGWQWSGTCSAKIPIRPMKTSGAWTYNPSVLKTRSVVEFWRSSIYLQRWVLLFGPDFTASISNCDNTMMEFIGFLKARWANGPINRWNVTAALSFRQGFGLRKPRRQNNFVHSTYNSRRFIRTVIAGLSCGLNDPSLYGGLRDVHFAAPRAHERPSPLTNFSFRQQQRYGNTKGAFWCFVKMVQGWLGLLVW